MNRAAIALIFGLIALVVQASSAAEQQRSPGLQILAARDCSKGTVEARLDCLNTEIIQLKRQLEGRDARIMPLQR